MTIPLFDVQAGFGGMTRGSTECLSTANLTAEMERYRIDRALVRITPEDGEVDLCSSNTELYAAHAQNPALLPCPAVVPNWGRDLAPEADQVDEMIRNGAGAACIRPGVDCWSLAPWESRPLFLALAERRLPAFCLNRMVSLDQLGELASRYPILPFILAEVNYRQQRSLLALLETFPNIYLSIGNNYTVHYGIEQLVSIIGAQRLLFGTGYPVSEPMTAITQLAYAQISDEEKALIGSGNMTRLLEEVVK